MTLQVVARVWSAKGSDRQRKTDMGELLDQIASTSNLKLAWSKVRANKGAAGIDRKSIAAFEGDLDRRRKVEF
jgi:hypothetical protein